MIIFTLIAANVAAQAAPAPEAKGSTSPSAEKRMVCCASMAKGEGCCCCKNMRAVTANRDVEGHGSDDANGHAH